MLKKRWMKCYEKMENKLDLGMSRELHTYILNMLLGGVDSRLGMN